MKLRERQDSIAIELTRVVDILSETRTAQGKFALAYDVRLKLDDVRQNLRGLGYEIIKPVELRLDKLIQREAKNSAQARALSIGDIRERVLAALPKHGPAWDQIKADTKANDTAESGVWDYVEADVRAYLLGPPSIEI